ncbi:MAG: hypothetical protein Q8O05_05245, partial [Chloroflexota bacterium]|nr:hypothetical protein [Chloroflexota bacterium]
DAKAWSLEQYGFVPNGVPETKRFLLYKFDTEKSAPETPLPPQLNAGDKTVTGDSGGKALPPNGENITASKPSTIPFTEFTNGSFESWTTLPGGLLLPERWVYHQDGSGGSLGKYTLPDGIKDGSASALVRPSSAGNSFIRYEIPLGARFRGGYVQFSVWVKSTNTAPEAIQVDIQDIVGPIVVRSYDNTDDWQQIVVGRQIDASAEQVIITLNVKAAATDGAFFDNAVIATTPPSPVPTPKPAQQDEPEFVSYLTPLAEFTNGSFESWSWTDLPRGGVYVPDQWINNRGGRPEPVEKYTQLDDIKEGSASALLRSSSIGNSFIRYEIPRGTRFRGCYVQFSVWVKSQNTTPDAIQVDIQDISGPMAISSYANSGDWEQIVVRNYIDSAASQVLITLNVNSSATGVAFFDGATLMTTPSSKWR